MKHLNKLTFTTLTFLILIFNIQSVFALAPAMLPKSAELPMKAPMPIDGVWTISTINKNIRIEGGRSYAVDSWDHLVWTIQPDMVVSKNIVSKGAGEYSGYDLVWLAPISYKLKADGKIGAVIHSIVPLPFDLIPVELDNPEMFQQAMSEAGLSAGDGYGDDPAADCQQLVVDPDTRQEVCLD